MVKESLLLLHFWAIIKVSFEIVTKSIETNWFIKNFEFNWYCTIQRHNLFYNHVYQSWSLQGLNLWSKVNIPLLFNKVNIYIYIYITFYFLPQQMFIFFRIIKYCREDRVEIVCSKFHFVYLFRFLKVG